MSKGIDINENIVFTRNVWLTQRVSWVVMALLIACAFAGLFGSGPLARAVAGGDRVSIEYERFTRSAAPLEVRLRLSPTAGGSDTVRVAIDQRYLDGMDIEEITPEPESTAVDATRTIFVFRKVNAATGGTIALHGRPERPGYLTGTFVVDDGEPIELRQLVYP